MAPIKMSQVFLKSAVILNFARQRKNQLKWLEY